MLILGLDTSTARLSLCLWNGRQVLARRDREPDRRMAEVMMPEIDALFKAAQAEPSQLTGVAAGLGPGSFTSLRVGAATAMGLADALDLPVIGMSSFQVIASASAAERVAVFADAHRGQYYAALYVREERGWRAEIPEQLCDLTDAAAWFYEQPARLSGPAAAAVQGPLSQAMGQDLPLAPEPERWPQAEVLARSAEALLAAAGSERGPLLPLYLRRTHAEEMQGAPRAGR